MPINYKSYDHSDWIERIIEINKSKGRYNSFSESSIKANAIADYLEQAAKGRFKNLDEMNRIQYEYRKKYLAIFSMSAVKNNILLWSHYSNSHKGVSICYNTRELIKFIEDNYNEDGHEIFLEKVKYYKSFPFFDSRKHDDPKVFMIKSLVTKSVDWKYEKEYRLISNVNSINFGINLPDGIIREVILGARINQNDREDIIDLLKKKSYKIKLTEASISKTKFGLSFERISY